MAIDDFLLRYGSTALAVIFGALAIWRGGSAERTAALIVLTGWFVTPLVQTTFTAGVPVILLDSAQLIGLFVISTYCRRLWSLLITACMGAGLISHFANVLAPYGHKLAWAYVVSSDFLGGVFVALCLGLAGWECQYLSRGSSRASVAQRIEA